MELRKATIQVVVESDKYDGIRMTVGSGDQDHEKYKIILITHICGPLGEAGKLK